MKHLFLLAPLASSACLTDEIEPEVDTTASEIRNSTTPAAAYFRDRAAVFLDGNEDPTCTATRVGPNWLLTAMHCNVQEGQTVAFYTTSSGYDRYRYAEVAEVFRQQGTYPNTCYTPSSDGCTADSDGDFADVALVRIVDDRGDLDAEGPQAVMAWKFPVNHPVGTKVGAGRHQGEANDGGRLLQVGDNIVSDNDGDGHFDTGDDDVDSGDSGGPFYVEGPSGVYKVTGVLWGWVDYGLNDYNVYTSIPEHLSWILATMDYRWQGMPVLSGKRYAGTTIDSFIVDAERICQYACERTANCEAYNYDPNSAFGGHPQNECELKDNVTGMSSSSEWRGALRHGARSGVSNDVVGYTRSDGFDVVVHRSTDAKIHELWKDSGWNWGTINAGAPAVASDLSAYVRSDGYNVVVYRSTDNRIIQVYLSSDGWEWNDLTEHGGTGTPAGDPVAYVRPDGVDAIVYRTTLGRIIELSRGLGGWTGRNLSANAVNIVEANSDPSVVARSDGYSSVVFRGGSHVYELYRSWSGNWTIASPTDLAQGNGPAPAVASRPYAYTHADGINAIVYRSTGNRLIELWLVGNTWYWGELSSAAITGDPSAYVRTDTIESVVVRSTGDQILEIANAPWTTYNLSAATGQIGLSATDPATYIRSDGFNVVLFETSDNRVREMTYRPGEAWSWRDLSVAAGETP